MKKMYILLAVLLALSICVAVPVSAENYTTTYEKFTYEYTLDADGNATIVSANGTMFYYGWQIPETLDGHTVVALGDRMFTGTVVYNVVYLPVTVQSLGEDVFNGHDISAVYYGGTESEWAALLATMGSNNDCLYDANVRFVENGFEYDIYRKSTGSAQIVRYRGPADVTEVNFPATVSGRPIEIIGNGADYVLYNIRAVEKITFPDTVTVIWDVAYTGLPLKEIVFPDNVESVWEKYGFQNCSKLESLTIPDTLKTFNGAEYYGYGDSFEGCDSLKDIYYGGTKTEWEALSLSESVAPLTGVTVHFGEESGQPGDFDDNGDLNMTDALNIYQYIGGNNAATALFSALDVNADGTVNMFDALALYETVSK